ncbi:hypothetical protein ACH5RR_035423 [Cinchona calisaya]|uniref:DUF3741 domain-containing protein n=1 Tax=Cinchona calisaya TaxID=153742 RepID=A0ABD2Y595_9GENT
MRWKLNEERLKQFCNDDGSTTSTLNQHKLGQESSTSVMDSPYYLWDGGGATLIRERHRQPTLEEMIVQLEMEEAAASRRSNLGDQYGEFRHRMSCVNSSDILRSARNALNHEYPRFSLDGKDAMYRSSFRNMVPALSTAGARNSLISCSNDHKGSTRGFYRNDYSDSEVVQNKLGELPATVGGERVVWCRPGVVAELMGLEAMPIPVDQRYSCCKRPDHGMYATSVLKRQNQRRIRGAGAGRLREIEKARLVTSWEYNTNGSCSTSGYRVMKPIRGVQEEASNGQFGRPMRHFRQNDTTRY